MKHGKRPTKKQKELIKSVGLNPYNWLIVKNLSNELHIAHRNTKSKRVVPVA